MTDIGPWVDALRWRLPRHAKLLDALVAICRDDERIRVLELQCSVARGAGDELSDLDLGLAATDQSWQIVADGLPQQLRAIAPALDVLAHTIPEWGSRPHRRIFVQYADGRQIDLVVQPASAVMGRVAGAVVLHDPDGRLSDERVPGIAAASADDVRAWELLGWASLADAAKYLERGSAWEALARLGQSRDLCLRLWAAAEGVPYPAFGLTSLLDADPPLLPDGLEATAARADLDELRDAARACAGLLREAAARARKRIGPEGGESPMGDWVSDRLD